MGAPGTTDDVIACSDVGKQYRLDREATPLWDLVTGAWRRTSKNGFWALRGVTLTVRRGEILGIVGRNGSGKSTLLQILAGVSHATEGSVLVQGRVGALLELGSGFNPEFTGRENVLLNAAMLGLDRKVIESRIDLIQEFAGLGQFFELPLRTYSSGMQARLAFSTAAHLDPDILIVDEALSVGDVKFQRACVHRMEQLVGSGMTVLLVSHDLHFVERFAVRVLVLEQGRVICDSDAVTALGVYRGLMAENANKTEASAPRIEDHHSTGEVEFLALDLLDHQGRPQSTFVTGETMGVRVKYRTGTAAGPLHAGISVWTQHGLRVGQAQTVFASEGGLLLDRPREFETVFRLAALPLMPGRYALRGGIYDKQLQFAKCLWGWSGTPVGSFAVSPRQVHGFLLKDDLGLMMLDGTWSLE